MRAGDSAQAASVAVITHRFDPTADVVVDELNRRGVGLVRFDVAEFPEQLTVSAELAGGAAWSAGLRTEAGRTLRLDSVCGIYYRRPTGFVLHPDLSEDERRWAAAQARIGFGGLLGAVGRWLNHPSRIGYAEYKPVQLSAAAAAGLKVPRTLLTNSPSEAGDFGDDVRRGGGAVVCKPLTSAGVVDHDGYRQPLTAVLDGGEDLSGVARTMHLFQQWVPKDYEVRLTVVDGACYAARIDAHSDAARIDWRADYDALSYSTVETPPPVQAAVARLLAAFSLRFACLDFAVDHHGRWWFLDLNPNGQWAWLESETGLPITAALTDGLQGRTAP